MGSSALAITAEHRDLAAAVTGQLTRLGDRAPARATLADGSRHPAELWSAANELGWLGLAVAEEHGGSGFGLSELAIVLEAQGRALSPGPFLPTVAASFVLQSLAPALVARLADGSAVGGFGMSGNLEIGPEPSVTGHFPSVLGAPDADVLVLSGGDDVVVVETATAGVSVASLPSLDTTRGIGDVTLHGVTAVAVLRGAASRARTVFRALAAAEAVGISWATLEMARDYAQVREQFGRTIGTFQAVKHHLADMLVKAELTTAAVWDAARADDIDSAAFPAAVAAAHAIDAVVFNAQKNIQLHGGVGFTWEHDAHLYLRRALTLAALLGDGADPLADIVSAQRRGVARASTFTLPAEAEQYRAPVREAVAALADLPADQRRDVLVDTGYLVPHWPRPWGRAADPIEQLVIEEEFGAAGIKVPDLGITGWVVLTIAQAGTDDQRERWVEPVLRGQVKWCQLFSEPGAGSDAAAVRTTGKRVEGGWVVSGQKVWTSLAQQCQWGLATVRTDPDAPKHAGVTMMAIDMSAPGVQVKPLRELTGEALFNEVFFDDVFIPDADVIGDENRGWLVARATLGNERISIGGGSGTFALGARRLIELLDDAPPEVAAGWERRVGEVLAETHTLKLLNLRQAARAISGDDARPEAGVTKLVKAENQQHLSELAVKLAGVAAVVGRTPEVMLTYLYDRSMTIAGGTSEIMRNTIAERVLRLPRDPLAR